MEIRKMARGTLQIDGARITHRNFEGRGDRYNREGDRNFSLIIPNQEIAEQLMDDGWNIKMRPPREEGDEPFLYLKVKIRFSAKGPKAYLKVGDRMTQLDEDTIRCLDEVSISNVDLDIRPYDWEVNGNAGRTAYLDAICVTQDVDRFYNNFINSDVE